MTSHDYTPKSNLVYLDFEYNGTGNKNVNPICVAIIHVNKEGTTYLSFWLDQKGRDEFLGYLQGIGPMTLVSYQAGAEARALMGLGINAMQ